MGPWCIFVLCIAAAYGELCDNDHKKNEIIHKIDDYFKHHHNQELLKHVLEHYIYPDMYIVDLGRHYEVLQQEHHHHEHHKPPHHHHTSTIFGKRSHSQHEIDHLTKELEHLVKEMDDLNDACVLDIVYFVEGKLGLSHLGKTTVPTHAPPTTHAVHHTTTTTTTTTTKPQVTTTLPPVTTTLPPLNIPHVCNGLEFVQSVAIGNTVLNPRAGLCTDGTHSQSEALVLNTCHADSPATWKSGYNVMQNCDRIPRYTPIATFLFGMYSMDGSSLSGVFINCTPNGFKMAVQVCGHGPLIFEVQTGLNHSGRENPYNYYTVNW